jgi:hypothetical protein
VSGQCLSASGAGRALTPARHLPLGGPLPRQLGNTTWAPPRAADLCSPEFIRYYPPSRTAIPDPRVGTHALLPLTPVPPLLGFPRLACLIHAANVRSEPGSNPSKCMLSSREEHVLWSIPSLFGPTQSLQTLPDIAVACNLWKGRGQVGRSTASPPSLLLPTTHLSKIAVTEVSGGS